MGVGVGVGVGRGWGWWKRGAVGAVGAERRGAGPQVDGGRRAKGCGPEARRRRPGGGARSQGRRARPGSGASPTTRPGGLGSGFPAMLVAQKCRPGKGERGAARACLQPGCRRRSPATGPCGRVSPRGEDAAGQAARVSFPRRRGKGDQEAEETPLSCLGKAGERLHLRASWSP